MKCAALGVTALTLVLCSPANAQASKLNAPVSRQPTVGSEIDRGQEAAFDCGLHNISDVSKFVDCMKDVVGTNKQKGALSEPFEFGLYVRALQHAYVQGVALNSVGMLPIWRDRLVKIMKSSKLTLKDFCAAIGEGGKCDLTKMSEQTYGVGSTAPKLTK